MGNQAQNTKLREVWDRLVLLLISRPLEGWEREFQEIVRREIKRLSPVAGGKDLERSDD
jgi:hypothetical protein